MIRQLMIDMGQIWQSNGGVADNITCLNQEIVHVNHITKNNRPLFDVFISLYDRPGDRLIVQVTEKQTFQDFVNLIR